MSDKEEWRQFSADIELALYGDKAVPNSEDYEFEAKALIAMGYTRTPALPAEGSPEEAAAVERMAKAFYDDYFAGLIGCAEPPWEETPESHRQRTYVAMLAALRALAQGDEHGR